MIWFSGREIFLSLFYSAVYGVSFAFLVCILLLSSTLLNNIRKITISLIKPRQGMVLKFDLNSKVDSNFSAAALFVLIIIFALGYIFLSYYTLDGGLRVYTLLISISSFFIFKILFSKSIFKIILFLTNRIFIFCAEFLNIIIYPLRIIFIGIAKLFRKKRIN